MFNQERHIFLFYLIFVIVNLNTGLVFMLCFIIQKRSRLICIFQHFKQFTVARKKDSKIQPEISCGSFEGAGRMEPRWELNCALNIILSKWRGQNLTMQNNEFAFHVQLQRRRELQLTVCFNVLLTKTRQRVGRRGILLLS